MRMTRLVHLVGGALSVLLLTGPRAAAAKPEAKPAPLAGCPACEIAYTQASSYTNGPQDLMLMKRDGSSKTTLLAGGRKILHKAPRWAPDGTWIAFITNAAPKSTLRLIKNDGTGLTNVVDRCHVQFTRPAWNPVPINGGYWLVYSAARDAAGNCIVAPAPGIGWPSQNLWAVHVSLGSPVLVGQPVCLTCGMNPNNQDLWMNQAWTRDGTHLSALQRRYDANGMTASFYVFDVTMSGGVPALVPAAPFELPGFPYPGNAIPSSWAHFDDSIFWTTRDEATGKNGLLRLDLDLSGVHAIREATILTTGTSHSFLGAIWSPDDSQLVYGSDGIWVITLAPFSPKQIAPNKPKMVDSPDWKPLVP